MTSLSFAAHAINESMLEVGIYEGVVVLIPHAEWHRLFNTHSMPEVSSISFETRPGRNGIPIQEFTLNGITFRRGHR